MWRLVERWDMLERQGLSESESDPCSVWERRYAVLAVNERDYEL